MTRTEADEETDNKVSPRVGLVDCRQIRDRGAVYRQRCIHCTGERVMGESQSDRNRAPFKSSSSLPLRLD